MEIGEERVLCWHSGCQRVLRRWLGQGEGDCVAKLIYLDQEGRGGQVAELLTLPNLGYRGCLELRGTRRLWRGDLLLSIIVHCPFIDDSFVEEKDGLDYDVSWKRR